MKFEVTVVVKKLMAFEQMMLAEYQAIPMKAVLFHNQYLQLNSVIYPANIGRFFRWIWEIFCRKSLSKPVNE